MNFYGMKKANSVIGFPNEMESIKTLITLGIIFDRNRNR